MILQVASRQNKRACIHTLSSEVVLTLAEAEGQMGTTERLRLGLDHFSITLISGRLGVEGKERTGCIALYECFAQDRYAVMLADFPASI